MPTKGGLLQIRHVYVVCCIVGTVMPYWQFMPWLLEHGPSLSLFVRELFANRIGGFFGLDVVISAIVLCIFVGNEGRRLRIPHRWVPVVAVLLIGVSLGLPLFLYMRELHLDRSTGTGPHDAIA